jgi:hypothetical protein
MSWKDGRVVEATIEGHPHTTAVIVANGIKKKVRFSEDKPTVHMTY